VNAAIDAVFTASLSERASWHAFQLGAFNE